MLKQAKDHAPSVIFIAILMAVLTVGLQTVQLLFTPAILKLIEDRASLQDVLFLIIQFTIILLIINAFRAYLLENKLFGRIEVRTKIITKLAGKRVAHPILISINQTFRSF